MTKSVGCLKMAAPYLPHGGPVAKAVEEEEEEETVVAAPTTTTTSDGSGDDDGISPSHFTIEEEMQLPGCRPGKRA